MDNEKVDSVVNVAAALAGRADKIDQVLVIYQTESGIATLDNGLHIDQCLYLMEGFKFWMMACMMGITKPRDEER